MKVLHVITSLSRSAGGPARSVQGLVAAECAAGIDAWIWPINGGEPWVARVRVKKGLGIRDWGLGAKEFDLVHIHGLWSPLLHKVAVACRKAKVPYLIAPRGMLEPWSLQQKWLKKRIARFLYQDRDLKKAAALHATAESEAAQFRALGFKNYVIVSPNGVNVPEKKVGGESRWTKESSNLLNAETQRRRAVEKVEEWLAGVDEATFGVALEKLVAEKTAEGEYRFKKEEERGLAIEGAKRFFAEFSRKIVPLSDGRCVYFAPDARAKTRNGRNAVSWAEYAFHAVSNGGVKLTGKDYHERWYNPHKIPAFASIVSALTTEHCFVRLSGTVKQDAIVFAGVGCAGETVQIVTRLDETGNMEANLSEVTFTSTSKGQKKLPRLVPLTEAVRTVVHHQTTAGSYPPDKDIVANSSDSRKGDGEKCLNVGIGECLNEGRKRALFVSRMHPKKGVLELVESWVRVFKNDGNHCQPQPSTSTSPHWQCELVYTLNGDEEKAYEQQVKDRIRSLGMTYVEGQRSEVKGQTVESNNSIVNLNLQPQPDFILTGPLNDDAKWNAYARADLFVLPTYSENFGIVVAEALYAGLPVITTKGTPWSDLVTNKCGWWIDLPSEEVKVGGLGLQWSSLDDALREATSTNYQLPTTNLHDMGANGRRLVESKYLWPAVVKAMVHGYEQILTTCENAPCDSSCLRRSF